MFPAALTELLDQGSVPKAGGWYAHGKGCEGSIHHSPTPLVLRDMWLVPWLAKHGITDRPEDSTVSLCGTCADNLQAFQEIMERFDGEPPWAVRRAFGNRIRALGEEGWAVYAALRARGRK